MFVSQIDGSTLRTLCMQHGPLITFHLNLTQGSAVVRYSSKDEAAKAQKSLHMYVLELSEGLSCFCDNLHPLDFCRLHPGACSGTQPSWQSLPGRRK